MRQADWPTRVRSADQGSELAHAGDLYWSEAAGAGGMVEPELRGGKTEVREGGASADLRRDKFGYVRT